MSVYGLNVWGLIVLDTVVFDGEFNAEELMNALVFAALMWKGKKIEFKKTSDGKIKVIEIFKNKFSKKSVEWKEIVGWEKVEHFVDDKWNLYFMTKEGELYAQNGYSSPRRKINSPELEELKIKLKLLTPDEIKKRINEIDAQLNKLKGSDDTLMEGEKWSLEEKKKYLEDLLNGKVKMKLESESDTSDIKVDSAYEVNSKELLKFLKWKEDIFKLSDNSEIKYNKEIKKFEITDTDGYVKTYSEKELKTLIKENPELFETIVNKIKIDKAKGKLDKKLKNEKLYKEVAFWEYNKWREFELDWKNYVVLKDKDWNFWVTEKTEKGYDTKNLKSLDDFINEHPELVDKFVKWWSLITGKLEKKIVEKFWETPVWVVDKWGKVVKFMFWDIINLIKEWKLAGKKVFFENPKKRLNNIKNLFDKEWKDISNNFWRIFWAPPRIGFWLIKETVGFTKDETLEVLKFVLTWRTNISLWDIIWKTGLWVGMVFVIWYLQQLSKDKMDFDKAWDDYDFGKYVLNNPKDALLTYVSWVYFPRLAAMVWGYEVLKEGYQIWKDDEDKDNSVTIAWWN